MSVVDPEKIARISKYIASRHGSDYQEYLLDYDDKFANYRVNAFCDSATGTAFGLIADTEVSALAKLVHLEWDTQSFGFKVAKLNNLFGDQAESKATIIGGSERVCTC